MKSLDRVSIPVLLAVVLLPATAVSQDAATLARESYWWTLSPDITPAELKHALSPAEAQKRYAAAMEKGTMPALLPSELARVRYYVDGGLTPYLFRFSEAFDAFATNYTHVAGYPDRAHPALVGAGISEAGITAILAAARESAALQARLLPELQPAVHEFLALVREAEKAHPQEVEAALERKDVGVLSALLGRSRATLQPLFNAWERDPVEEVSLDTIEILRSTLSEHDWQGLRSYLLSNVAPLMAAVDRTQSPAGH